MLRSGSGVSPVLSELGGGWLAAAGDPGTLSKKREGTRETRKGERSRGERFGSVLITVVVI
jgi:hypothetical protein